MTASDSSIIGAIQLILVDKFVILVALIPPFTVPFGLFALFLFPERFVCPVDAHQEPNYWQAGENDED